MFEVWVYFAGDEVNWVQCDTCELWFHLLCVGLADDEVNDEEDYMCFKCKSKPHLLIASTDDDSVSTPLVISQASEQDEASQDSMSQVSVGGLSQDGAADAADTGLADAADVAEAPADVEDSPMETDPILATPEAQAAPAVESAS